jgi:spermidine/putrescine transport system ATP-binding protein
MADLTPSTLVSASARAPSASDTDPPVIAVDDVAKHYGDFVAVSNARFDVRRAEFFSLLGPSGCGKTTVLRMIAGFESVTGGQIRLEGVDVARVPPYKRNVNTVFQQYALFPHMTVADNVAFGPRTKGIDEGEVGRRVDAMLEVVRLGSFADRHPSQLSGGQKQRVALARALVNDPSALLLDEPLSALDLKLRQAMQLELKRIQREVGITFVFVTHDQEEALTMSDRIAVMSAGRIEQVGSPEEIYDSPLTPFVAGFIGSANLLPATVEGVRDRIAVVRVAGDHAIEVPIVGAHRFAAGDAAMVMIRPERIELARQHAPGEASLPVTVVETIFQGPVLRCVLRDARGDEIVAHLGGGRRPAGPAIGEAGWASWQLDAARLLPPR